MTPERLKFCILPMKWRDNNHFVIIHYKVCVTFWFSRNFFTVSALTHFSVSVSEMLYFFTMSVFRSEILVLAVLSSN